MSDQQLAAFANTHAWRIRFDTGPATSPAPVTPTTSPTAWPPPDGPAPQTR
ncbi:hypothetical protein [Streptomyces sp. NPDC058989]|uniref:hypothetical protein n=1 Tax=Streptomyces sp. NPDC058989 TaxID=3346686 RepID=UPI0036BD398E